MKLKSFTNKDRYGNMTSFEFYEGASVDMGPIPPMMQGVPDHPGGPKGTDTVPAWLTPGEFVMNAEATRMFEPQIEEMNNAGRAVQAQQGGTIPEYAAGGGQMPAANIDGNEFAKAAMAVGLPTDNATLNKLVNLVNQGMSVQEAAKRIANVPQYSADGGPVYLAEGSGGLLDSLMGLFKNNPEVMGDPEVARQVARATSEVSKDTTDREDLGNVPSAREIPPVAPTRPSPTMSNQMYMDFLKNKEGFRSEAYLDSAGVPTIGYGFTEGVQMGDIIDEKTANERLLKEMARTDQDYNSLVSADLNPNQQAAVKSLLYNIGGPQFANSKARAALNSGDFESFKKEAAEFRMANGKVIPGLENRRRDELELFFKPYSPSKDDSDDAVVSKKVGTLLDNDVYEDDMGAFVNTPEGPVYLDDNQLQAVTRDKLPVDPGLLAAVEAQKSQVPPIDGVPPKGKFDTNGDGVLSKEELLAARNQTIPSKDDVKGSASTPFDFMPSGNQIVIDSPESLIARQEQILNDMVAANAPPAEIYAQQQKIDRINNMAPRQKAFSDVVEAQNKIEPINNQIEDLETQIERLEAAGLYGRANALRSEVASLNAQKPQLEEDLTTATKAQDDLYRDATLPDGTVIPNVGKVTADQLESDGSIPPRLDIPDEVQPGQEMDSSTTDKPGIVTPDDIVSDNDNAPDDGSTNNQTPDANADEGNKPENKDKVETSTNFFKDLFGDLFDSDELKRMAIMYVGSRALGGSHNGSLNFVAKQYVKRVDSKVSAHKKYVKELTKGGLYKPSSIAKFNKTKNLSDLEKKGATYSATGGASITKLIPVKGGGFKETTVVPVKNSITNEISYRAVDGTILPAEVIANARDSRPELKHGTDEYYARRDRVYNQMEKSFAETRDNDGNFELDGKTKKYYTNVGPRKAAREFFAWAESVGQDPESTQSMDILTMAQEQMIEEAKGKKFRPGSLTPYLEYQMIREETTAPELFLLNPKEMAKGKPPKMIRMDQMQSLYQNIDHLIHSRGNKTTRDAMFAKGVQNWQSLSQSERDEYNKGAEKDVGINGFYNFMQDTMAAVKAKEPKT